MPTMISTALPKDALSRPARVCPNCEDIWSVASPSSYTSARQPPRKGGGDKRAPRTFASGTMAMKLNTKRSAASQFKWCEMKLRGMKMRSTLSQEPRRKCL